MAVSHFFVGLSNQVLSILLLLPQPSRASQKIKLGLQSVKWLNFQALVVICRNGAVGMEEVVGQKMLRNEIEDFCCGEGDLFIFF